MNLLINGTIAEMIVCNEINKCESTVSNCFNEEALGEFVFFEMDMAEVEDSCDCFIYKANCTADEDDGLCTPLEQKRVEVKFADNGGKYTDSWGNPQYYAEIVCNYRNGEQGYCEYLADLCDYVVYYDKGSNTMHWYDGFKFAAAVKSRNDFRFPAKYANTEGVLFSYNHEDYGYLFTMECTEQWENYKDKFYHRASAIANTAKKNRTIYKHAVGLPTLY